MKIRSNAKHPTAFIYQMIQYSVFTCVMCLLSLNHVQLFATLWTVTCQVPLSVGIVQARILEWVAMPSSRGVFLTQGLNPGLPHYRWILYHLSHQGSILFLHNTVCMFSLTFWHHLLRMYIIQFFVIASDLIQLDICFLSHQWSATTSYHYIILTFNPAFTYKINFMYASYFNGF